MTKKELIKLARVFAFKYSYDGIVDNQPVELDFMTFNYIFDSRCRVDIHHSTLSSPEDVVAGKFRKALITKGKEDLRNEIKQLLNIQ